jgi:hypothetical protein
VRLKSIGKRWLGSPESPSLANHSSANSLDDI